MRPLLGVPLLGVPLLGVPPDIATAPGHREDQALFAQDVDGAEHSVTADAVLLLKLLDRRQGPLRHSPLAILPRRMPASCW